MAEVSYLHLPSDDQEDVVVVLDSDPDHDFSPSDLHLLDSENLIIDILRQGVDQVCIDDDSGATHLSLVDPGAGLGFDDCGLEDYACDEDPSLALCWDTLLLQEINPGTFDFEWEEVDEEREALGMFFDEEDEDLDGSVQTLVPSPDDVIVAAAASERRNSEWEVLLNSRNFDTNVDVEHDDGEYNYTAEYETLFAQFTEHDLMGKPPASKAVVDNLSLVVVDEGNAFCAICKDEMEIGGQARRLPCSHLYHGDCIVPWLGIRNTCPVCRYELPTDDPVYERRRARRAGR